MANDSLEFAFTSDQHVVVRGGMPTGFRGPLSNELLYPFVMAGKLMFNFPDVQREMVARMALSHFESAKKKYGPDASVFGCVSSGFAWGQAGQSGRKSVRADFFERGGMIVCTTKIPWADGEKYARAAIDAALDFALRRTRSVHPNVVEGVSAFFDVYARNAISDPGGAVMLATAAAMIGAGIELGKGQS
jgi:hypothetical protein